MNTIGRNTYDAFKNKAEQAGQEVFVRKRRRINLTGVGSGSSPCDEKAKIPIAVRFENERPTVDILKSNIADGSGADLPAILGNVSMVKKDAVMILRHGKEQLVFPGPGGYKIQWSPGTKRLNMTLSPSGHYVIPCDEWNEATTSKDTKTVFATDRSTGVWMEVVGENSE